MRDFVGRALHDNPLGDDDDIFATGFVNSLFALELVTFVEGTFGITIESEDLDLDNFRTVSRIAALVARKAGIPAEPVPR
ncbi:MAG: acyl carrier protein [Actinomycetota bacterium]|nr:acyl carrier protein [Actinomycetota bacterium]